MKWRHHSPILVRPAISSRHLLIPAISSRHSPISNLSSRHSPIYAISPRHSSISAVSFRRSTISALTIVVIFLAQMFSAPSVVESFYEVKPVHVLWGNSHFSMYMLERSVSFCQSIRIDSHICIEVGMSVSLFVVHSVRCNDPTLNLGPVS